MIACVEALVTRWWSDRGDALTHYGFRVEWPDGYTYLARLAFPGELLLDDRPMLAAQLAAWREETGADGLADVCRPR